MLGHRQHAGRGRAASIEDWEVPVACDLVPYLDFGPVLSVPYQPRWFDDVPADAVDALVELVDIQSSGDVLVLPSTSRPTNAGSVYVPTQVFGVGTRGVALWVDDLPHQRVASVVRYSQVGVVEYILTGDHGQLSVLGADHRLVLRYRATAWPAVRGLLTRLRGAVAGIPVSADEAGSAMSTWDRTAEAPLGCLADAEPEIVVTVSAPRPHRWPRRQPRPPAATALLTGPELVVLRETAERSSPTGGVDLLAVPRSRITWLSGSGAGLVITAAGIRHTFVAPAQFVDGVVNAIGPTVSGPHATTETQSTPRADGQDAWHT